MIKIEDLRIGNYVMYNGIVVRVYGIIPPAPRKDKRYGDGYLIEVFEGASTITARLEGISAIELRGDWFNKSAYIDHGHSIEYSNKRGSVVIEEDLMEIYGSKQYSPFMAHCGFVHQWQNLHYTLFSEELNMKL
jgi:hypothetical protein